MSRFLSTAGEQVAELAASYAEGGRLSRGKTLFRKGAVSDLSIGEGSLIASVRGSEGDDYETTVGTVLAPPGIIRQVLQEYNPDDPRSIDLLLGAGVEICPRDSDLAFGCDCADWDELCKHVVAVLLAFADRVDLDETVLLMWRGIDLSAAAEQQPESPTTAPASTPQPRRRKRPQEEAPASEQSSPASTRPAPSASPPATDDQPPGDEDAAARTVSRSELEALLGDTIVKVPNTGAEDEASSPSLPPGFAEFFGVGMVIEPPDVSAINPPDLLFQEMHLGPLADLGPELATALSIIAAELAKVSLTDSVD
jgi:uncharacterized Zn finger protein